MRGSAGVVHLEVRELTFWGEGMTGQSRSVNLLSRAECSHYACRSSLHVTLMSA